jgi:hypothetical protein
MRTVAFWASATFLLFLGLSGLQSFVSDWSLAETVGQRLCTVGQATYGACGIVAGAGAILKKSWAGVFALAFAISAGLTAGLASVAWGGADLATGVASGGLGLLIGILLYWGIGGSTGSADPEPSQRIPTDPA